MKEKYHFIAIGGVGMSGLAKYLLQEGFEVSGSDICESKYTQEVKGLGAKVYIGHNADNVPQNSTVVASSAIKDDNPEIVRAKELNLPILHRSDVLKQISERSKCFIGFAGTHGKTTTSGLASYVMSKADLEPSYVVGGIIPELNTNANYNSDNYFIAELDESDGTVVKYRPNILVINNLDSDHTDFYKNGLSSLVETFDGMLEKYTREQKILICTESEGNKMLKNRNFITYGFDKSADYRADNIEHSEKGSSFDIFKNGEFIVNLKIKLLGKHNVLNALAVFASLMEAGVDYNKISSYFVDFTGMGRRLQYKGEINGAAIFDDYAHHPTEIKATLNALSEIKNKEYIVVFQPHRYSRLQSFWNDFILELSNVKRVIVTDVYSASENEIDGINSEKFVKDLSEKTDCVYASGSIEDVAKVVYPYLTKDKIIVGLGAGTITNLYKELVKLSESK